MCVGTTRKVILVIGGGFFGMYLAEQLALGGHEVKLIEREPDFMSRASFNNQARVHQGYHYPRSILTALRSRLSFPRFVNEFRDCIASNFAKYYLIASPLGKVTAQQFLKFCERIGAPCDPAPERIRSLTNPGLVEACYSVTEYAFDAIKLRDIMARRLQGANVTSMLGTSVEKVRQHGNGLMVTLRTESSRGQVDVYADHVFNCTYSHINQLLSESDIELIPLKHEMTEMCLVEVPDVLKASGITVMCGPFFSVMPFPAAGLHSFSHVRYTPHYEWHDDSKHQYKDSQSRLDDETRYSAWRHMQKDAARYIPILSECEYKRSLWEVKTVLPRSETDDSRPILFRANHGLRGLHCVMGGKIDNVYDVVEAITSQGLINLPRSIQ